MVATKERTMLDPTQEANAMALAAAAAVEIKLLCGCDRCGRRILHFVDGEPQPRDATLVHTDGGTSAVVCNICLEHGAR
jgi:hypothetical protein